MDGNEERDRRETEGAEREDDSAVDEMRGQLERSGERLQEGRQVNLPGDSALPARSLVAIAIFVVVFVLVYLLCWAVMGTIGLAVGVLIALAASAFAVKLYADRAGG
jgi:Flp pilus assembly protein TadB